MAMIRGMKWCLVQGAWCGDKERRLSQAAGTDGAAGRDDRRSWRGNGGGDGLLVRKPKWELHVKPSVKVED